MKKWIHGVVTLVEKLYPRPYDEDFRTYFAEADEDSKTIWIHRDLTERSRCSTLIHEMLHIVAPEWSETRVKLAAHKVSRVLWEQGYRWQPEKQIDHANRKARRKTSRSKRTR